MTEKIKEVVLYLKSKNILLVYCPNESLGTDGPFVQLDNFEEINHIINFVEGDRNQEKITREQEILISG